MSVHPRSTRCPFRALRKRENISFAGLWLSLWNGCERVDRGSAKYRSHAKAGVLADPASSLLLATGTTTRVEPQASRRWAALAARSREVGVATEMLLMKAKQVSDDGGCAAWITP